MRKLFQIEGIDAGIPLSSVTLRSCVTNLTSSLDIKVVSEAIKIINKSDTRLSKINHVTEAIKEHQQLNKAEVTKYDKLLGGIIFKNMNPNGFTVESSTVGLNRVLRILEHHHETIFTDSSRVEAYGHVSDAISPSYLASVNSFVLHLRDKLPNIKKIDLPEATRKRVQAIVKSVKGEQSYESDRVLLEDFTGMESATLIKHAIGELRGAIILDGKKTHALKLILKMPVIASDLNKALKF